MKKIDVRVKKTYIQLTNSLMELLTEKKFDDITVLEICNNASVHRATFYKHFVDKHDFLNKVVKMKLSELDFGEASTVYNTTSVKRTCMEMMQNVFDFVMENKKLFTCVSGENYSLSFNTALTNEIANYIETSINKIGNLKSSMKDRIPMMSNYYAGAIVGLVKWWITSGMEYPVQELIDFSEVKIDDLCNYFDMCTVKDV